MYNLSYSLDHQRGMWIGGVFESASNLWKWTTSNETITWNDWYPGRPTSNGNHCIYMNRLQDYQGRWKNQECSLVTMHVCEFAMV